MKGLLLLCIFFGLAGGSSAQEGRKTIGWLTAPYLATNGQIMYQNIGKTDYSIGNGVFFSHDINDNFGYTTTALLRYENRNSVCFTCPNARTGPLVPAQNHIFYLDLPVNLAFNLDLARSSRLRSYILFGYTYSRLVHFYQTATDQGQTLIINQDELPDISLREATHIVNFGLEFRFNITEDYMIGLTPVARLPVFYITEPGYIALKLKVGRNL